MDIDTRLRLTRYAGTDGITDTEDESSGLASQLDGSQRVGCLAALRDGNHHVVREDDGLTVAELRGVLHFNRYAAEALEELFADESGVPAGAASHDDDAPCACQLLAEVDDGTEGDAVALHIDASTHAVAQAVGLFEDFLHHKERVAALLQLAEGDINLLHLGMLCLVVDVHHFQLLAQLQNSDVAVVQIDHLIGIFRYGAGIGSQVEIAVSTETHDQRRALAGADDGVGVLAVEDGNGVSAYHLMQCHLHRFEQREVVAHHDMFDELHQHLGVRDTLERNAACHEVLFDGGVVLDDAVMDESQTSGSRIMGVCIGAVGLAVGGPTGVSDACAAADVLVLAKCFEVSHLAFCLIYVETAVRGNHGNASAVITAILQSFQTLDQNGICLLLADISYNSTHNDDLQFNV